MGDVTGLARSSTALADLFVMAGRLEDAIALLADSISLNFEKGSALVTLRQTMAQAHGPEAERFQDAFAAVDSRLTQAESILGRVVLPGETPES
jgi:sulfite reductase beta subunit-like hemoprotein